jgi:hypothetical protein
VSVQHHAVAACRHRRDPAELEDEESIGKLELGKRSCSTSKADADFSRFPGLHWVNPLR